jgi:hypothetical protein
MARCQRKNPWQVATAMTAYSCDRMMAAFHHLLAGRRRRRGGGGFCTVLDSKFCYLYSLLIFGPFYLIFL